MPIDSTITISPKPVPASPATATLDAAPEEPGQRSPGSPRTGAAEADRDAPGTRRPGGRPTKVEVAKEGGRHLRGSIAATLEDPTTDGFGPDDVQLLKFHGVYQQEDRDARAVRRRTGAAKEHRFMVRARIPGGRLTGAQYLAFDRLADRTGPPPSLRITTRQTLQLHGLVRGDLRPTLRALDEALVTTLAACGDVGRNVMAPPAPGADPVALEVRDLADRLSRELEPRSRAWHEIWVEGERVRLDETADREDAEPLYGPAYLPRKLKTAIAVPPDNSVDVWTQDVGFLALVDRSGPRPRVVGLDVVAGGGLGMTHRKEETYARLASPLGSIPVERAPAVLRAIVAAFRDLGDRTDRRHARLKYLVEEEGVDRFRAIVEERAGFRLDPWVDPGPMASPDRLGANDQGDGLRWLGLWVPNGRIVDTPERRLRTALATALRAFAARGAAAPPPKAASRPSPGVLLTPAQNLLITDLDAEALADLEAILEAHRVPVRPPQGARRFALACPALPTCGLALAEAERFLPEHLDGLEEALARHGLEDEPLVVRMTGCPNGCARPYAAEIGLVGRGPGTYDVFVGGDPAGDHLAFLWETEVAAERLVDVLEPLLARWARERRGEEGFGAFVRRLFGPVEPHRILTGSREQPMAARASVPTSARSSATTSASSSAGSS